MKQRRTLAILITAIIGIAAIGCGEDDPMVDSSARMACKHFRNVADDAAEGILTDAEAREKLKEVDDAASVSENPVVAAAARQLLAGATSGTMTEEDAQAMADACADVLD